MPRSKFNLNRRKITNIGSFDTLPYIIKGDKNE